MTSSTSSSVSGQADIAGTLHVMNRLRNGENSNTIFNQVWAPRGQALDALFRQTAADLSARQGTSEALVAPLVGRVAALDVTQPNQEFLEAAQKQVADLQTTQGQLQSALDASQNTLQEQQQNVAMLTPEFTQLQEPLRKMPSPYKNQLLQLGEFGSKLTSRTVRESYGSNSGSMPHSSHAGSGASGFGAKSTSHSSFNVPKGGF